MPGATAQTALRFAGYAAVFDAIDRGGDIIRRGAFRQSLGQWQAHHIPLLWQHDMACPIGRIAYAAEDRRGLRIIAQLADDQGKIAQMLRCGAISGLSFGYRVRACEGTKPRQLMALDIQEVSLVTMPMQPAARVHLCT